MSIATELQRLKQAKDDLKSAITSKGVIVSESDSISIYADKVNLIQTGGTDITLTSITITDIGEYEAQDKTAYNKVSVSGEYFYKKYTDGEGNTYIINENGETIITYTGETPTPTTDEYFYITLHIPSDKVYSSITSYYLDTSAFTEVYFDGEPYDILKEKYFRLVNKSIEPNTQHTVKARLVNDDDTDSLNDLIHLTLNYGVETTSGYAEVHKIQYAYGTTKIGKLDYDGSHLKEIVIPDTVTSIGNNAFNYCTSLTNVTIPNSVTSIDNDAFNYCTSLTSITIGNSVTSIGDRAFYYCTSLTSVTYNGTKTQFASITKGISWKHKVPTTCIVHCTDGDYPITDFS